MSTAGKIISVVVITGLGMFGIYAAVGVRGLMNIGYTIIKYQIRSATLSTISLDLTLRICNPSIIKVGIVGYNIDVALNGTHISTIASDVASTLDNKNPAVLIIPITVDVKKVFGAVKSQQLISDFTNQRFDQIVISLSGTFKGTVLGVTISKSLSKDITLQDIQTIMNTPDDPNAQAC